MIARMALCGVIGGAYAAACMSALRLAVRRGGLVDEPVPDVVEAWATQESNLPVQGGRLGHQLLSQVLHLGVGAAGGAVHGTLASTARAPVVRSGLLLGLGIWVVAFSVVTPLLGIARPSWRSHPVENALNIVAHLLYGVVTAVVADELARDSQGPRPAAVRHALKMG